jgi:hypothetical protein
MPWLDLYPRILADLLDLAGTDRPPIFEISHDRPERSMAGLFDRFGNLLGDFMFARNSNLHPNYWIIADRILSILRVR